MIKTGKELAEAARNVAENHKTLYVLGCIGAPLNSANKIRYTKNLAYNRRDDRTWKIRNASSDTFGFDCVCLIKSLLWGWNGDTGKVYGGATYGANKVPDWDANAVIRACQNVSTDFTSISVGEAVWLPDHIGIYLGDGLVAECTSRWKDGVQVTAAFNIGEKSGYNGRTWVKHGKLPWITYDAEERTEIVNPAPASTHTSKKVTGLPVIKYGVHGECAKALQILLAGRGHSCGSAGADGIFGAGSVSALKNYQRANKLYPDGICGPATWGAILGL